MSYVTFDSETEVIWGVGSSAEDSLKNAKFVSFEDKRGGVDYEFACWCADLITRACDPELVDKVHLSGRLSVSKQELRKFIENTQ